jgi:hypothetical protein
MGNDGGSIPKRVDLVKSKQKRVREDDKDRARQLWAFCALSKVRAGLCAIRPAFSDDQQADEPF